MIDAETQLYGVIGNPVRHSLSPVIHNGAFQRMGLNAAYLAFEVKNLEEAVSGIKGLGIRGVSVTIPFKTRIIPFLDRVDEVAGKIRAVNTIRREGENSSATTPIGRERWERWRKELALREKEFISWGRGERPGPSPSA